MKNQSLVEEWLKRAKSNLGRARIGKISEEILYEDLCFDCEQAVEKSLKALLVHISVAFPHTHSISSLIELIEDNGIEVPDEIKESISLTAYAVSTRYPGDFEPVDEEEYQEALKIAKKVFNWAKKRIKEHD
ncbi:HEPN domain-containing protein [Candidatus Methanoperedens nitratireducens]|uniref:HEPN n=1 Tax=Candidatus Methanoperedens nitratireducens TaxID=1392998 RepID=A0A284VM52_9EURY|nr:HEPN domain-containing protein [Candidatus Methanoperedens nitroreducens]SNQ60328.1 HEPN [Candidatus Methanoperedens nitroreducens]